MKYTIVRVDTEKSISSIDVKFGEIYTVSQVVINHWLAEGVFLYIPVDFGLNQSAVSVNLNGEFVMAYITPVGNRSAYMVKFEPDETLHKLNSVQNQLFVDKYGLG